MKIAILLFLSLVMSSCNKGESASAGSSSDSSFLENTLIDKDLSEVKEKYKELFKDADCSPSAEKICDETKMTCLCHQVTIAQTQNWARSIYLVSVKGKIVLSMDGTNTQPHLFESKLETAKAIFGTVAPSMIYESQSGVRGFKSMFVLWDLDKGYAGAGLACPTEKVGGVVKIDMPLRNCFVYSSRVSRLQKFEPTEGMTLSKLSY